MYLSLKKSGARVRSTRALSRRTSAFIRSSLSFMPPNKSTGAGGEAAAGYGALPQLKIGRLQKELDLGKVLPDPVFVLSFSEFAKLPAVAVPSA
jgi:hypothetical protein